MDDSFSQLVETTLTALVEHYRQPIHAVESSSAPPYFDETLGRPPRVPPVLQHWVDRLSGAAPYQVVQSLLEGYLTIVRPVIFDKKHCVSQCGVTVLQHYELFLSQCWDDSGVSSETRIKDTENPTWSRLDMTLHALTSDVTTLTASKRLGEEESNQDALVLCNIVLPTMVRVLYHGVRLVEVCAKEKRRHDETLLRIFITSLAFGSPRLDPRNITPILPSQLNDIMKSCAYPPQDFSHDVVMVEESCWSKIQSDGTYWDDPVTGITTRAAQQLWKALKRCIGGNASDENIKSIASSVCLGLGMDHVAKAMRAHFFGRDMFSEIQKNKSSTIAKPSKRFPLGTREPKAILESPFELVPSRIHVAINFVALLKSPYVSSSVLEETLPVCYALLDSSRSVHIAMGATALIHILSAAPATVISEFGDGLVSVFELACRTCRDGPPLMLVCLAQSLFFQKVATRQKERRQATARLLTLIRNNSYKEMDTNDNLILGLLLGGIVPLLNQHASEPNADALEMGRFGLTCLLPLVRWDYSVHGRRVQLATLVALVNLMMGAYPIMPRHGGKIMSELLGCMGHAQQEVEDVQDKTELLWCRAIVDMSRHAAAVSVVLCGERATSVLDHVEQDESYDRMLAKQGQEIREQASRYHESNNKPIDS